MIAKTTRNRKMVFRFKLWLALGVAYHLQGWSK